MKLFIIILIINTIINFMWTFVSEPRIEFHVNITSKSALGFSIKMILVLLRALIWTIIVLEFTYIIDICKTISYKITH